MNRLEVKNLCIYHSKKISDENAIVKDISIDILEGELIGLLGLNGSGKSSIASGLCGFIPHVDSNLSKGFVWGNERRRMTGKIFIDGEDKTLLSPQERYIGLVPQNLLLYPKTTVYGNIARPLENLGINKEEIDKRVKELSEKFGIADILNKDVSRISGGQQQRTACARAIIKRPKVLIFDEAFSNLDTIYKGEQILFIKSIIKEYGSAAIFITHDPKEASIFYDRLLILKDKEIHQIGTPLEIYQNPSTIFVGKFFSEIDTVLKVNYNPQQNNFETPAKNILDHKPHIIGERELLNIQYIGFRKDNILLTEFSNGFIPVSIIDKFSIGNEIYYKILIDQSTFGVAKANGIKNDRSSLYGIKVNSSLNNIFYFDKNGKLINKE